MPNLSSHAVYEIPLNIRTKMFRHFGSHETGSAIGEDRSTKVYATRNGETILVLRRINRSGEFSVTELNNIDPEGKIPPPLSHFRFLPQQMAQFDSEGNFLFTLNYQYNESPKAETATVVDGKVTSNDISVLDIINRHIYDISDAKKFTELDRSAPLPSR